VIALLRGFLTLTLAAAFAVVFAAWLAATTVKDQLLDDGFYIDAARRADVYERVYDRRVFAEQLKETTHRITGGIEVDTEDVVAVVSRIAPPDYLQLQVERAIGRMTAFARGDTDELDLRIDLTEPSEQIKPVIVDYVQDRLAALPSRAAEDRESFVNYLQQSLADLQTGRLPNEILTFPVPPDDVDAALDLVFPEGSGLSTSERDRVRQALVDGRTEDAFVTATDVLVDPVYQAALVELKRDIGGDGLVFDPVARAAAADGDTVDGYIEQLRDLRDVLTRIQGFAGFGGPVLLVLVAALIFGVHLPRVRSGLLWAGLVAGGLALLFLLGAGVIKVAAPDVITELIDSRNTGEAGALNPILSDMSADMTDQVANGWLVRALVVLGFGGAAVVVSRVFVEGRDEEWED
jgi:hypothetical protein